MPDNIPNHKTEEELAALRAADPAAFDDDVPDVIEADEAAEAERLAAEKADAEKAEAEAKKPDMIPKGRLNEVLAERDRERERAEQLAAELDALKKGPPVDYAAEVKALDDAWNSDEFDGSHEDYMAKRDGLIVARAEQDAIQRYEQTLTEREAQKAAAQWATVANAFVESHPEYRDAAAKMELEAALHGVFAKFPDASDADKLVRAHKIVLAMNGKSEEAPKAPNADRNKADAQLAAKASAQPPAINGGVSSAGGPIGNVDFANMKPGTFSKLSKDQQAAALGGADAL
ncbi:MAG: hypothetical protein RJA63_3248 [Pseudomonadota bacterium]|jgi:fused signal recognition particle receptor